MVPKIGGAAALTMGGAGMSVDTSDFEDIMTSLRKVFNQTDRERRTMILKASIQSASMTTVRAAQDIIRIMVETILNKS